MRKKEQNQEEGVVSCLKKERVIVKHIPKMNGIWGNNPKHVLAGGIAEGASKIFVVPKLASGIYANVLTDNEKAFLEEMLGLEYNALSVYKKTDNFWSDANENGISRVTLSKEDTYLDLSNPTDYIKYKILLANKDYIAPSLQALEDYPKATYQYVIIAQGEENKKAKTSMSNTMESYKEYGKIEDDVNKLRLIIEIIEGRPTAKITKLEFLQTKINDIIQTDAKLFLKVVKDPMLDTKVIIKRAIEEGILSTRGNFIYVKADGTPLCEMGEEPTMNIAAKYLNAPKHQDLLISIQSKLND